MRPKPDQPPPAPDASPARPRPSRKRGGQPGNHNAYRHGFYAQVFTPLELQRLNTHIQGELLDEEALLRVQLCKFARQADDPSLTFDQKLASFRACILAVDSIQGLQRARKAIYHGQTSIEKAIQELDSLPFEQDGLEDQPALPPEHPSID